MPEDSLKKIVNFMESLEEKKKAGEGKEDPLAKVIGTCEGPDDMAEKHNKYVYG